MLKDKEHSEYVLFEKKIITAFFFLQCSWILLCSIEANQVPCRSDDTVILDACHFLKFPPSPIAILDFPSNRKKSSSGFCRWQCFTALWEACVIGELPNLSCLLAPWDPALID